MKFRSAVLVLSVLLLSSLAGAQEQGYWRATSTTAKGVTGDIQVSAYKLTIDFVSFTIAHLRTLKPDEVTTAFASAEPDGVGSIYRLNIPADRKFLHKNTMCGSDATTYMATYVSGKTLYVAFFSGEAMPVLTPEAMNDATNLCGTYTYVR